MGKINFGHKTGENLKYSVYSPSGTEREADVELPESPVGSSRYIAVSTVVQHGDDVIVKNDSDTVVGHGEYLEDGWLKNG